MSDLQRDIERIDAIFEVYGLRLHAEAWQRLKPRLTPDRERVARAMCRSVENGNDAYWRGFLPSADAAIAAMGETP